MTWKCIFCNSFIIFQNDLRIGVSIEWIFKVPKHLDDIFLSDPIERHAPAPNYFPSIIEWSPRTYNPFMQIHAIPDPLNILASENVLRKPEFHVEKGTHRKLKEIVSTFLANGNDATLYYIPKQLYLRRWRAFSGKPRDTITFLAFVIQPL